MKKHFAVLLVFIFLINLSASADTATWICPECGREATRNFCSNCGTKRPLEEWTCPNCGYDASGYFCSNCGMSFEEAETETEQGTDRETEEAVYIPWLNNVELYEFSFTDEDEEGYIYEISYRISPWILLSNTDLINDTWDQVGKGNDLPSFNDWGLSESENLMELKSLQYGEDSLPFSYEMNDMYYCMGSITIKNITEGWSITEDNPRSYDTHLSCMHQAGESPGCRIFTQEQRDNRSSYYGAYAIGRIFYSDSVEDNADGVDIRAKLDSDKWGPVSFILMTPENFSPKYPDGTYLNYLAGCKLDCQANEAITIGVINKDGDFVSPASDE